MNIIDLKILEFCGLCLFCVLLWLKILTWFDSRTDSSSSSKDSNSLGVEPLTNGFKSFRGSNTYVVDPATTSTTSTTTTTAKSSYQNDPSELSKRISNTLARHGIDETANKRNSYIDTYRYITLNNLKKLASLSCMQTCFNIVRCFSVRHGFEPQAVSRMTLEA